ncbi:hypothetical protein [Prosthecobacter sp.]|uniref:hypothetical protein n=1 Tax=Prosthecobacter sp. TaxID=1965333 RepID=UPI002ABB3A40|nr:hypothetical protein [Prosthecobacter sp.]MDZ4405005.1 hypothetical protein [Prosthecobacter sp.]
MKTKLTLAAATVAILLSNCTYHTYVVPKPTPAPTRKVASSKPSTSSTSPDNFQAITKPSTYSR